jgi:hypothetical protein
MAYVAQVAKNAPTRVDPVVSDGLHWPVGAQLLRHRSLFSR